MAEKWLLAKYKVINQKQIKSKAGLNATSSSAHLFVIRGRRKETLEHFKPVIKIYQNRGHIFSEQITEYEYGDTENISSFTTMSLDV